MAGAFAPISGAISTAFAPLAAVMIGLEGLHKVMGFLESSADVFIQYQEKLHSLEAAVESQGGKWEEFKVQVLATADALKQSTRFSGGEVINALTVMTNMGNNYKDALNNVGLVADFAAAKNMDLEKAATLLGRAMAGNIGRLAMYLPQIKQLSKEEQDWAHVRQIVNDSFGGRAVQLAGSYADQIEILKNNWAGTKKMIGEAILSMTGPGIRTAIANVKALNELFKPSAAIGTVAATFDMTTTLDQLKKVNAALAVMKNQFSPEELAGYEKLKDALEKRKAVLEAIETQTQGWKDRLDEVEGQLDKLNNKGNWNLQDSLDFTKLTAEAEDLRAKLVEVGEAVEDIAGSSDQGLPEAWQKAYLDEIGSELQAGIDAQKAADDALKAEELADKKWREEQEEKRLKMLRDKHEEAVRIAREAAERIRQIWIDLCFEPIREALFTAFNVMFQKGMSLKAKLNAIWAAIRDAFFRAVADMTARWLAFKAMTMMMGWVSGGTGGETFGVDAGYGGFNGGDTVASLPGGGGGGSGLTVNVTVGNNQVASIIRKQTDFALRRGLDPAMA